MQFNLSLMINFEILQALKYACIERLSSDLLTMLLPKRSTQILLKEGYVLTLKQCDGTMIF